MKKHIKMLSFCFIIMMTFFVGGIMNVRAELITKDKHFFSCKYLSEDEKYEAYYEIYANADSGQNSDYVESKHIRIKKFDGTPEDNTEVNIAGNIIMNRTIITGECPKYMVVRSNDGNSGRHAHTFDSEKKAGDYLNKKKEDGGKYKIGSKKGQYKVKGEILYLQTNYYDMLEGVRKFNQYLTKEYSCSSYGGVLGTCSNWVSETSYSCDYGNQLTLGFKQNFSSAISGMNNVASYPTADSGKCPSVVYEIINNGDKYYKFFGDWPDVCKNANDNSVVCYKYIHGATKTQYVKELSPPEPYGPITGTYYKYKGLTLTYDTDNPLFYTISGSTDGTISSMTLKNNNKSFSIAMQEEANFEKYVDNFSETKGESDLPSRWTCASKEEMIAAGYKLTTLYNGLVDSNTYCTNTSIGGYTDNMPFSVETYYLYNTEKGQNQNDINNLIANVSHLYKKAGCEDNATGQDCMIFQSDLFDSVTKINKECQEMYIDFSVPKNDLQACEDFKKEVEKWAEAGYFGNRIITSETGTDCDDTLGSLGKWLKTIYDIMKYAVPVVIVVLGIKDFISGTISGNDDALKKAGSAFIKRLIWGAAFVALPVLITMILTFAFGGSFADICIF